MSLSWVEATRLASKGGPADRLRRGLIALCAALAAMIAAAGATIPSQWRDGVVNPSVLGWLISDTGLAFGLLTALAVMALPVVHLAAQSVRVGAPARDRRLAGMRASGATRADIRQVVRAEAFVCCVFGAVVGVLGYYAFMWVAPHVLRVEYTDYGEDIGAYGADVTSGSYPVIALEVWPHPLVIIGAAALVPLVAAVVVPLTARRVARERTPGRDERSMSPLLAVGFLGSTLVAAGSVLAMIFMPMGGEGLHRSAVELLFLPLLLATFTLLLCTLVIMASSLSARLGAVLARSSRATAMLAGRMMQAHPRLAARSAVSLVLVGLVGGLAIPLQGVLEGERQTMARDNGYDFIFPDGSVSSELLFYTVPIMAVQTLAVVAGALGAVGLLVAVAEQVSLRGRDLARQVAVGVPRRVVRRALVIEAVAPVAIMASVALLIGAAIPVLSVSLTGNADLLEGVAWVRLVGFWLTVVTGSVLAAWLGGLALPRTSEPQRIRDRE